MFERYVNFDSSKPRMESGDVVIVFERYVNFDSSKPEKCLKKKLKSLRDM